MRLLFDILGQTRVSSKLDLEQDYNQIVMTEDLTQNTTFCTDLGESEYILYSVLILQCTIHVTEADE